MRAIVRGFHADGAASEVGPFVAVEQFEGIESVLDHAGERAVIAGRCDDDAVGGAHGLGQSQLLECGAKGAGIEDR